MTDETYTYTNSGDWTRFDNIAGIGEELSFLDEYTDDGKIIKTETFTIRDEYENILKETVTKKTRIG